jgi:hypothetical protein
VGSIQMCAPNCLRQILPVFAAVCGLWTTPIVRSNSARIIPHRQLPSHLRHKRSNFPARWKSRGCQSSCSTIPQFFSHV